jgi:osmotically-inducible protein OsmY
MGNMALVATVKAELEADPKVDAAEIAVSADEGVVTLRGTVGSPRQKFEATRDAERVRGVISIKNELQVRILDADQRHDAEVRGAVLQAMALNSLIPPTIDAKVDDGYVTLKGSATWNYQRSEAEFVASNVPGVRGVRSEIALDQAQSGQVLPRQDVVQDIKKEFGRLATLEPDSLTVEAMDDKVILSGVVHSWAAHDMAVGAAWMVPGVTQVEDNLRVQY